MSSIAHILEDSDHEEYIDTVKDGHSHSASSSSMHESPSPTTKQIQEPVDLEDKPIKERMLEKSPQNDTETNNTPRPKPKPKSNPRRVEQNRLAQRAFRMRKDAYIKRLEDENAELKTQLSQLKGSGGNSHTLNEYKTRCQELELSFQTFGAEKELWTREKLGFEQEICRLKSIIHDQGANAHVIQKESMHRLIKPIDSYETQKRSNDDSVKQVETVPGPSNSFNHSHNIIPRNISPGLERDIPFYGSGPYPMTPVMRFYPPYPGPQPYPQAQSPPHYLHYPGQYGPYYMPPPPRKKE